MVNSLGNTLAGHADSQPFMNMIRSDYEAVLLDALPLALIGAAKGFLVTAAATAWFIAAPFCE